MKWTLVVVTILATSLSDLFQSYTMKRAGHQSVGARGLVRLARLIAGRKLLIGAIFCETVGFLSLMALLQIAPLSFAVPASAGSYVVSTALAWLVLHERISVRRAAGALIVLCGVALIGH
jgi:drug/metabolite transporter (DMT)-like permease